MPALSASEEWYDEDRRAWRQLLERMADLLKALDDLDAFIDDFFFRQDSSPDTITALNLSPDENENDAWTYEALVSPRGVVLLGRYFAL